MHLEFPEFNHEHPTYYDVIEENLFTITSESSRVLVQNELVIIFLQTRVNCGLWWRIGPKWECLRVNLRAPLTSVGVVAMFL